VRASAEPLWFGPQERPLAGWLHLPVGGLARGGVVVCPSIAGEHVNAQRTLRSLAEQLAHDGLAVLRLDYDGTGDSAGEWEDPDRLAAWTASITTAVQELRSAGLREVALIGMRVGALLAARAASVEPVEALVLWDPVVRGRAFLREQRALSALAGLAQPEVGAGVETPGFVFPPALVAELETADLASVPRPLASHVLVLTRDDRPAPPALRQRFAGPETRWAAALGQHALLDVSSVLAEVPRETLADVLAWTGTALAGPVVAVHLPARPTATVGYDAAGGALLEHRMVIGTDRLAVVLTEGATSSSPAVLFLPTATEHCTGPGRMWTVLARELAAAGRRCLRLDLSGIGESPPRADRSEEVAYAPEALDDVLEAAAMLSPESPSHVVLVGLCSGAYHAIEAGILLGARGVAAINPVTSARPAEVSAGGRVDPRRNAYLGPAPWVRAVADHPRVAALEPRLPPSVWWMLDRVGLLRSPAAPLRLLDRHGTRTLLLCGPAEAEPYLTRAGRELARLQGGLRFRLATVEQADHALLASSARTLTAALLTEHVLAGTLLEAPDRPRGPGRGRRRFRGRGRGRVRT